MKFIVAFLTCFLFKLQSCTSKEILLPLDSQQEECIKDLKTDRDTMAYLSAQEFPPEDNEDFNEFFACTWKKQGYQDQNGQLNYNALEGMIYNSLKEQAGSSKSAIKLVKQMARIAVDECKNKSGNSHGQVAVKMQNCMYRELIKIAEESKYASNSENSKIL